MPLTVLGTWANGTIFKDTLSYWMFRKTRMRGIFTKQSYTSNVSSIVTHRNTLNERERC